MNYILDKNVANLKLERMALEIYENNMEEKEIILAGIKDNGSVVARCIQKMLEKISGKKPMVISISLDKRNPTSSDILLNESPDFNNKVIVIVDDVANSGKTLLYALKPFLDFQPKKIQTLVLVDRSHKTFSVQPDYVGITIATTLQEHIFVEVEGEEVTGAYLK
jgi:pyrimidine operon attenuation protein / uracil phosphoribosyltransferase